MRTRIGCILINPYQSKDGSWYADAWYGVLEAKKDCMFKRLPPHMPAGEKARAIEGMESAALLVLRQQGIERRDIRIFVASEENNDGAQRTSGSNTQLRID